MSENPELPTEETEEDFGLDDFLGEEEDDFLPEGVEEEVVTLRSTSAGSTYVPIAEPMPLSTILAMSGLTIGANCQFYIDSTEINGEAIVQPGATVLIVGNVKGGAF